MGLLAKAASSRINPAVDEMKTAPQDSLLKQGPGLLKQGLKKQESLPPSKEDIQSEIRKYYDAHAAIQGIVLEAPAGLDSLPAVPAQGEGIAEHEEFTARVNHMVSFLGTAMALPSRRCLVLFSDAIDRELLAHRLCKSLKTSALSVFMADNIQAVSDFIRPYS